MKYHISTRWNGIGYNVCLLGRNAFRMDSIFYDTKREANQMARRLSENLGLEFKDTEWHTQ